MSDRDTWQIQKPIPANAGDLENSHMSVVVRNSNTKTHRSGIVVRLNRYNHTALRSLKLFEFSTNLARRTSDIN